MAFKLLIECSKDIDKLSIDFSDGTSSLIESPERPEPPESPKKVETRERKKVSRENSSPLNPMRAEEFLDVDEFNNDYTEISSEVLELPKINLGERPVKVANELQNLNI